MSIAESRELACKQIAFARDYTCHLLEDISPEEWFQIPPGASSHLAWQVGHLAMAEYGLTMLRIRGKLPEDAELISNDFLRCFTKGSTPVADAAAYPSPTEIRHVFDAVHATALDEIPRYSDSLLQEPLPAPTAVEATKLGSLFFCPAHEMLHAGQIGMLRRMLGKAPLR